MYAWAALASAMGVSENAAVMALGVNGRMGQQYRHHGMSERVADRLAAKAGFHPAEVWPEWMDHSIETAKQPCVECGALFFSTRKGHVYCGRGCKNRRQQRLQYQLDPAYSQRQTTKAAAYYSEAGDYVRARERRRYWAARTNG